MKKMLVIQITMLILISGALGGMLLFTEVYDEVQSKIVEILCLSCIKLEPKTIGDFTFKTANGEPHPSFVLENLSKGPVFLHYSEDVCHACDIMLPIIQEFFNVEFEKYEVFSRTVSIPKGNLTYLYINIDHSSKSSINSFYIYDKESISGLPMFTVVTLGYDRGTVKPYYTSLYGTFGLESDEERKTYLAEIISNSIDLYDQNFNGYVVD